MRTSTDGDKAVVPRTLRPVITRSLVKHCYCTQLEEAEARAAELRSEAQRDRAAAESEAAELREQARRAQEAATRAELAATQHVRPGSRPA